MRLHHWSLLLPYSVFEYFLSCTFVVSLNKFSILIPFVRSEKGELAKKWDRGTLHRTWMCIFPCEDVRASPKD